MVSPVKNVFKEPVNTLTRYVRLDYQAQKPPYNLRLNCRNFHSWAAKGDARSWSYTEDSCPVKVQAANKARERLVGQLGESSQIGASIAAEWRGSVDMISGRLIQLWKFTRAVRRGRLLDAANILELPGHKARSIRQSVRRKGHSRKLGGKSDYIKDFGSVWLEYSYGWAPLVDDIHNAIKIIDAPIRDRTIKGRATLSKSSHEDFWYSWWVKDDDWTCSVEMVTDIEVVNPNLFLSNQLGLTNPASWVLEGIPFSFVVDWFSNISQWVSQLTDFAGLNLKSPQTSYLTRHKHSEYYKDPGKLRLTEQKGFTVLRRVPGIPPVSLKFGYEIPNWKRGLNAISLLTQALGHK